MPADPVADADRIADFGAVADVGAVTDFDGALGADSNGHAAGGGPAGQVIVCGLRGMGMRIVEQLRRRS